jgi:hypothetical protein
MDMLVKSWLFGTVSPELQDVTRQCGLTARAVWLTLENRFIGNQETRALHINATFRNFVQGDLNVNDYCLKMKGFTNSLIDLSVDVPDRVLILNILRGLNKNFDHLHTIFTHTTLFPSFQKVHDDLCLKEIQQGAQGLQSAAAAPTVFYTMPMACFYECCVLTLIRKMVKLSASSIPLNNVMRSLLFQASLPPTYWVESHHTATFLLNRLPTKTIRASCLYFALFGTTPMYEHLRVFGCTCYPNMSATAPHKLAPRSACCVFLGYSDHHKGYRCLDLSTNRLMISRRVVFDEVVFPFATSPIQLTV